MPTLKCRHCDVSFFTKIYVMNHQKTNHEELIPICKSHVKGICKFKSNCWSQHVDISNSNETISTETSNLDKVESDISKNENSFEQ